ncbi:hypothetical protein C8R47DRAFT_222425 [Mycena vitilis]|nr:hypothetical protein C8R47DRAFT_222425 [Mycena vitilis]
MHIRTPPLRLRIQPAISTQHLCHNANQGLSRLHNLQVQHRHRFRPPPRGTGRFVACQTASANLRWFTSCLVLRSSSFFVASFCLSCRTPMPLTAYPRRLSATLHTHSPGGIQNTTCFSPNLPPSHPCPALGTQHPPPSVSFLTYFAGYF